MNQNLQIKSYSHYLLVATVCFLILASCNRDLAIREYSEEIRKPSLIESAFEGSGQITKSTNPITWKLPPEWKILPADGIRVAAFQIEKNLHIAETTVVILAAQSGSIEDNIVRWIDQLKLPFNNETIDNIIRNSQKIQTDGMILLEVYDFTFLTDKDQETMIVAKGALANQTLFVKIKGPDTLLLQERSQFFSLLQSLALSN